MSESKVETTLFIDVYSAPPDWRDELAATGVKWEREEGQPIADQIKLHKCTNLPGKLPLWVVAAWQEGGF
jgi:hypothetical protein